MSEEIPEGEGPVEVGICLTCGILETLKEYVALNGGLPDDHECEFTILPVVIALETAAMFEADRKKAILPRCMDCGAIPVEIFHPSSGEGRCRKCARLNWRALWKESASGLMEDVAEDPVAQMLPDGVFRSGPRNPNPWIIENKKREV